MFLDHFVLNDYPMKVKQTKLSTGFMTHLILRNVNKPILLLKPEFQLILTEISKVVSSEYQFSC